MLAFDFVGANILESFVSELYVHRSLSCRHKTNVACISKILTVMR